MAVPDGFRRNFLFKGFEIELEWMTRKLGDKQPCITTRSILLWGSPGCGKSHLARQYFWQLRQNYPAGTFWVDCKSKESLNGDYWRIGQKLGCLDDGQNNRLDLRDTFVHTVREHLEQLHGWLLVLDGVLFESEADIDDFAKYLPDSSGSAIVYTSVDRTLAKRQRLLAPSAIHVPPLSLDAAREFLFASLSIKPERSTPTQRRKAKELVKYYKYLPLGIHAAAHLLIAQGRALEKWSPGPTSGRLAQPFLEILHELNTRVPEAIALIRLLSCLYHRVPVALIQFGTKFMHDAGYDIKSPGDELMGPVRRLDNTIAVLISRGLIERQLQPLSLSTTEQDDSSPDDSRKSTTESGIQSLDESLRQHRDGHGPLTSAVLEDIVGTPDNESFSSIPTGIDTLRIHTVVQGVVLDDLRRTPERFHKWLVLAGTFLRASHSRARSEGNPMAGRGSVTDFYEYKIHGEALLRLYGRPTRHVPKWLFDARHELHAFTQSMDREIQNRSPSQSSHGSDMAYRSVFERSGTSIEEGIDTSNELFRSETWSLSQVECQMDSPTDDFVSHLPKEAFPEADSNLGEDINESYDELSSSMQWDNQSDITVGKFNDTNEASSPSILERILKGHYPGVKKDLGEFRGLPAVGMSGSDGIQNPVDKTKSVKRWSFGSIFRRQSEAEKALTALRARSSSQTLTAAPQSSSPPQTLTPALVIAPGPVIIQDTTQVPLLSSPQPGIRQHVRSSPASPRLLPAVLNNQAAYVWQRDLPIEENISVTRRVPAGSIPMVSTLDNFLTPGSIPEGYYSSVIMSRDNSRESQASVHSVPTNPSSLAGSPMPEVNDTFAFASVGAPSVGLSHAPDAKLAASFATPEAMTASPIDDLGQVIEISTSPRT